MNKYQKSILLTAANIAIIGFSAIAATTATVAWFQFSDGVTAEGMSIECQSVDRSVEWNILRDKAFAKDPYKMNGMSVIGKYLAKMKLKQWSKYSYKDTEQILAELKQGEQKKKKAEEEEKARYEADLKVKLSEGKITLAEYQTLVSTETQNKQLAPQKGNVITGQHGNNLPIGNPSSYSEALKQIKNPYQEQNFLPQSLLVDPAANLQEDEKVYLAMKWGRLYRPNQWVALENLYNDFMKSFDIQGAARIDTLKMICKTSLKMNQAIDCGDTQTYQKLSRVYDSMMKSAKFTEAQNKDTEAAKIDSASAIVDFCQLHGGSIPKYVCDEPKDIIDEIILDLKKYTKNLIYEDKALAQEIEKYLQNKRIAEEIKKDKQEAKQKGYEDVFLEDRDFEEFKNSLRDMQQYDENLTDEQLEEEYMDRRVGNAQ